jgi:hypothetical protein
VKGNPYGKKEIMDKSPLSHLLDLAQQREDVERSIIKGVARAKAEGNSWQAIANVVGGTKQAAQQRYGKAIEPLQQQGKYECSCGWTIVYPGWEAEEATEDISEHQDMHMMEDERDDYGTEPAEFTELDKAQHGTPERKAAAIAAFNEATAKANQENPWEEPTTSQLAAKTATKLDDTAPATYEYDWQDPTPRRTAAAPVDVEDDVTRVESGELDTAGNTIDWSGTGAPTCRYCNKTHHYDGKGKNLYFWIYPGCNPTHRDRTQHKTN